MDGVFKKDGRKKLPKERHLHLALSSLFSQEGRKKGKAGQGRQVEGKQNYGSGGVYVWTRNSELTFISLYTYVSVRVRVCVYRTEPELASPFRSPRLALQVNRG